MNAKVLFVEDEYLLREATREDLEELGLTTTCVCDCDEGWTVLTSDAQIDVLLTDIRTPGHLDGWQLARQAREIRPDLRVIYISGYSANGLQLVPGGKLLQKPYRFDELKAALSDLVAQPD